MNTKININLPQLSPFLQHLLQITIYIRSLYVTLMVKSLQCRSTSSHLIYYKGVDSCFTVSFASICTTFLRLSYPHSHFSPILNQPWNLFHLHARRFTTEAKLLSLLQTKILIFTFPLHLFLTRTVCLSVSYELNFAPHSSCKNCETSLTEFLAQCQRLHSVLLIKICKIKVIARVLDLLSSLKRNN